MSKEIKMADVFNLPAKQDESRHFRYVVYTVPDDNVIISANSAKEAEYLTHAINNHDRLSDEVSALREQLHSLFERVSGCEVSEFSSEQVNYLAEMIEGQMDANEGCINKIKSENAALRNSVNKLKADNLMQAWSMEKHLVVMQVFCLLVHQGKQGEANQWIFNTLAGPGLIPENNNQDAQTCFDEAMADEPQTFTEALKLVMRADEQGGS